MPAKELQDLRLTQAEIERVFDPFVEERLAPDDPRWHEVLADERSMRARKRARKEERGFVRRKRDVEWSYETRWARLKTSKRVRQDGKRAWCVWGERCMRATKAGVQRVHVLALARTIELLRPASVLEVGFGDGVNLFTLAPLFPNVRFAGAELTEAGVEKAAAIRDAPELPEWLAEFSPEPPRDRTANRRVELHRGDARHLPFADGSYDLVFTRLALEQMERIRDQALPELARVSSGHVAMVEPFREWNEDEGARDYVVAQDYFEARVDELPGYGLEPVLTFADMPHQLFYWPVLVVARSATGAG